MRVLLRDDVKGVGRRGDVVDVKSGFARNFLLPTGAALVASDATESQAAAMRRTRDVRDSQSREAAEAQRALIEATPLTIPARAGANGRLFGSVTEVDVVTALRAATGISLDRAQVTMVEHVKELGTSSATATLFGDVVATLSVEVVAK
ncbi:MAG: 50S ribosomal protein L9 [Acidimicrobiales bacterium]